MEFFICNKPSLQDLKYLIMCDVLVLGLPLIVCALYVTLVIILAHPSYSQTQQENDIIYDAEFFSIKYPPSWHVSEEHGPTRDLFGSGVILQNDQADTIQNNRKTPHSIIDYSQFVVFVKPRSSLPGSDVFSAMELVNSFIDYTFSEESLANRGAQLLSDNYTSLSGIQARSVSYTTQGEGDHNLVIVTADDSNIYEIAYYGQESKFQKEFPEVQAIISSFKIKGLSGDLTLTPA